MSHFTVCVLLNEAPNDMKEAEERINTVLNEYDLNRELTPYKRYFSEEEIATMRRHFEMPDANFEALLPHVQNWEGFPVAFDERGLYETTTQNPHGYTDYWGIMEILPMEGRDAAILTEQRFPQSVVTPDGVWEKGPWVYSTADEESRKKLEEWIRRVQELLAKHATATACLVDCHI